MSGDPAEPPGPPAGGHGRGGGPRGSSGHDRRQGAGGVRPAPHSAYRMPMVQSGSVRTSPLDDQLCFALYTASRAMTGCYRPMLDAVGLTYPQFLVMLLLWERGPMTVTRIGHALRLETGTLSPLLKRLEATELVTRSRRAGDERSVLVSLTDAGGELEMRLADVQGRAAEATGLSRAEVAELRDALSRLTTRLQAAAGAASA